MRLAVAIALTGAVLLAGCGGGGEPSGETQQTTSAPRSDVKVGLVTDIGGLHDRGFNQLAYAGLKRAQRRLGVQGRVLLSKQSSEYVPNLSSLAQQGYDLVIAVGFLMTDAVDAVAPKFPKTKFAIIDVDATTLKHKPKNVRGLLFKEQEGGYLIGYLAGLVAESQGGEQTVGVVAGLKIPPVDRFAAGFQAGAKAANPVIKVLLDYSQDFVAQAKCKELALNHFAAGSQVEFADAGACGLGVHDAARSRKAWSLGGDADQAYLGPQILSSELKKVDVAVYSTIRAVLADRFKGGTNAVFTTRNGGIGIGKISPKVPQSIVAQVMDLKQHMAAGDVTNIPTSPKT